MPLCAISILVQHNQFIDDISKNISYHREFQPRTRVSNEFQLTMKQKAYQILLACVKNMPDEVIVYDDGSKEDTQQVASSARATILYKASY